MIHLAGNVFGTDDASGFWYLLWSGFVGDLGEVTLIVSAVSFVALWWHKHSCERPDCHRIARHAHVHDNGNTHSYCRKHHPLGGPPEE